MTRFTQNKKFRMESKKAQEAVYPMVTNFIGEEPVAEPYYDLELTIHCAGGMDPLDKYPDVIERNYRAIAYITPGKEAITGIAQGYPKVTWNQHCGIPLSNSVPFESNFLRLEVIRERSNRDSGPSQGVVVVGRAQVTLPIIVDKKMFKRIELVRFVDGELRSEGYIVVSMKLKVN